MIPKIGLWITNNKLEGLTFSKNTITQKKKLKNTSTLSPHTHKNSQVLEKKCTYYVREIFETIFNFARQA